MKPYLKVFCIILTIFLVITSMVGCKKTELTKIRLNEVVRSIFYAPAYVAINKGFFAEEGFDIELTTGQGADKTMTALLSGQCEIGFAGPEAVIYVYEQGKEDYAVIFAQITQRDGSFLVSREPDPDFNWKKTKGKVIIGGRPGGVPEMTLEYILKKNDIIPGKDVELITNLAFNATAGAFTGGVGDYTAQFEPTGSMLEKENAGYVVASIGTDSGLIAYTAFFALQSYIDENPETIQKLTNAFYKGQLWVRDHTAEEIVKELKPFFYDADDDVLLSVVNRYREIGAWKEDPVSVFEHYDLLQDVMIEASELKEKIDLTKIINNSFAEKAINKK
ncbi:MAG: ABC transporter substrate-binding protein [Clostridiales bacterium]|nr:ABC transporter substrate-binding protein [Clostridiales bacterium]